MKRCILFVLLLCILSAAAVAEEIDRARDIAFDVPAGETGMVWQDAEGENTHTVSCVGQAGKSTVRLVVTAVYDGQAAWQTADAWLKPLLSDVLSDAASLSAQEIAEETARRIDAARKNACADADDVPPLWADSDCVFECVLAQCPYTPSLAEGASGKAAALLQERLQVLGYYTGVCDGEYGAQTADAVTTVQQMMYRTERMRIDALSIPTDAEEDDIALDTDMTDRGAAPLAQPVTVVNGIADARFQTFLYSDLFPVWERTLACGDSGDDVTRLQNRLYVLGCAGNAADGAYGSDTKLAVTIYQYCNGMEQTGIADGGTLSSVFSSAAQGPAHPLLQKGASGEAVKALQRRLRTLGFMRGSVDGDYGEATEEGVRNLQKYLRQREMDEIYAQTHETVAPAPVRTEDDIVPVSETAHTATEDEVDMSLIKTQVNGVADPMLLDTLYADSFPVVPALLKEGDTGLEVMRLQRRLQNLSYMYSNPDGEYGSGTKGAVADFQKRNGLSQDGVAGTETLSVLYSESAKACLKPYEIKVSTADQRVYVYAPDGSDQYTVLVKTFKCSTGAVGTPTPKGTYQASTCPGARWHYFKKFDCWAQYAYYIEGDIMFHSVLFGTKDGPVTQSSVNNLGRRASHGCVRLSVEDAKWIWTNCPAHTKVTVY